MTLLDRNIIFMFYTKQKKMDHVLESRSRWFKQIEGNIKDKVIILSNHLISLSQFWAFLQILIHRGCFILQIYKITFRSSLLISLVTFYAEGQQLSQVFQHISRNYGEVQQYFLWFCFFTSGKLIPFLLFWLTMPFLGSIKINYLFLINCRQLALD